MSDTSERTPSDLAVPEPDTDLVLGAHRFSSRLFLGTGKYASLEETRAALEISGTGCVTVAIRRVNLDPKAGPSLLDAIDRERFTILPNTAGCFDTETALRTARLSRELLGTDLVKLEVLGDERTLLPDPVGTLAATRILVDEGFTVLVYTSDDPRQAVHLAEAGATSVMPAGSPIGSGQGILNPQNIRFILDEVQCGLGIPVIVDAGVGTASDVAIAMELGADGVLLNTGIAQAKDPLLMAAAMRDACLAGRAAFRAGRIARKEYGSPSSPVEGTIAPAPRESATPTAAGVPGE